MKKINLLLLVLLFASCQPSAKNEKTASSITAEETNKEEVLTQLWVTDTLLTTSESVLYDESNDVLYVSCIAGVPPTAQDNDGFIAKVSPEDGSILELNWVEGIDAPKGMGLVDGNLYVSNIDEVVEIDISTAKITNRYKVEGGVFLNDITTDNKGNVYISDSGTNKVHVLVNGQVVTWKEDVNFSGPNGLLYEEGQMMMASNGGAGGFRKIDLADKSVTVLTDSLRAGDGIKRLNDGYLVSAWLGEIYIIDAEGNKEKILDTKGTSNSADIEFIADSKTMFVPTFFGNQVVAYRVNR